MFIRPFEGEGKMTASEAWEEVMTPLAHPLDPPMRLVLEPCRCLFVRAAGDVCTSSHHAPVLHTQPAERNASPSKQSSISDRLTGRFERRGRPDNVVVLTSRKMANDRNTRCGKHQGRVNGTIVLISSSIHNNKA